MCAMTTTHRNGQVLRFGNVFSEGFLSDFFRLGTTAFIGIEILDRRNLDRREFNVKDVEVFGDAFWVDGFWNRRASLLEMPSQHYLGGGAVVFFGNQADGFILEGCSLGITIRGNTADGRPGLGKNPQPVIELAHLWLSKERVDFDLVDRRCHRGVPTQCLQVFHHEVTDPNGPDVPVIQEVF